MASVHDDTIPVWKKLFPIISGVAKNVGIDVFDDVLDLCKVKLINVFLDFKCYSRKSYDLWLKEGDSFSAPDNEDMQKFMLRLSTVLDLETDIAFVVLSSYLTYDYYGKVEELKSIVRFENNVSSLVESIWHFYTAERMFILKTLRHIFENDKNTKLRHYKKFQKFIDELDLKKLWQNLLTTFHNLVEEIDKDKVHAISFYDTTNIENWVHRNIREQCEVVMLMILVLERLPPTGSEFPQLVAIFMRHNFGRSPLYGEGRKIARPEDIEQLKCAELGCIFLAAGKQLELFNQPDGPAKIAPMPLEYEQSLEMQIAKDEAVILLAWLVIKHLTNNDDDRNVVLEHCSNLCVALLNRKILNTLFSILSNTIFEISQAGLFVFKAVTAILKEFWNFSNDQYFIYRQEGLVDILALVMKYPELIKMINGTNLSEIFHLSIDHFPYDYNSLVKMCTALIKDKDNYHNVMELLKNIPRYFDNTPWPIEAMYNDSFNLNYDIVIGDSLIIPSGTPVTKLTIFQNMPACQYNFQYDFYSIFQEHMNKMLRAGENNLDRKLFEKISNSYELLIEISKNYNGDLLTDRYVTKSLHLIENIPKVFIKPQSIDLIRLYLKVQNALLIDVGLSFESLYKAPHYRKFFPKLFSKVPTGHEVTFTSFKDIFQGEIYFDSLLCIMLNEEQQTDDHSLLLEYLKFLRFMTDRKQQHHDIQVPGLAYLITKVFPRYQSWKYKNKTQLAEISHEIYTVFVKFIHREPTAENSTKEETESFFVYLKIFVNDEWFISHFMHEFCKDKYYLQRVMQHESYWFSGAGYHTIEAIRMQLVLLLLIMKYKTKLHSDIRLRLDRNIAMIAKSVTCHMVNSYNRFLAILSLRFLEILSQDENSPLMALLDLDHNQAQRTFLERLRDPLEDNDIKIHIIDLVATCILHQHGITAAFFNVQCSKRWFDDAVIQTDMQQDDVKDFMVDYFKNIKKSREYLHHPLQLGILRIMCYLWRSNKQNLIKEMLSLDTFWSLLAQPLFQKLDQEPEAYGYILEIFAIHLNKTNESKLVKVIKKFLEDQEQIKAFADYILELFKEKPYLEEARENRRYLLKTLTTLLVVVDRKKTTFDDASFKSVFIELSIKGIPLVNSSEEALICWFKFCFGLISQWGINPGKKESRDLKLLMEKYQIAFEVIQKIYRNLDVSVRNIILSSIKIVIEDGKEYFEDDTSHLLRFLNSFCIYMDFEYQQLSEIGWKLIEADPYSGKQHTLPWLLCATITNILLKMKNIKDLAIWFRYRRYIDCLIEIIPLMVSYKQTFPLTKVPIHGLILYMASPLYFDLCQLNLIKFYDDIEPPISKYIKQINQKSHPLLLKDAWLIVSLLVKFNRELLNKYQYVGMKTICAFMMLFHSVISYTLSIPEFTVDLDALSLLKQTLIYFDDVLIVWHMEWYKKSNRTFNEDLMNVKKVINACISAVLRPKSIVFYKLENERLVKYDNPSPGDMAVVVNELISVLAIAFSCLYKINPSLESMLDIFMPTDIYYSLISHDFSVPKFDVPLTNELTYGRLLCLAHFLCKTLNQLHHPPSKVTESTSTTSLTDKCLTFVGIIEVDPMKARDVELPNQKLSNFLSYAMYQYSGLTDPWITKLNVDNVKHALENLLLFLAGQVFLNIYIMEPYQVPYFKRNLCSELQFFYEYVKKRAMEITPSKPDTSVYYKSDWDMIKQVMVAIKKHGNYDDLADNNFLVILAQWFTNICTLQ